MTVKEHVRKLFAEQTELGVKEITDRLQASKQMVHLVIRQLLDEHFIEKLGRPPKTIYRLISESARTQSYTPETSLSKKEQDFLNKHFLVVTETGDLLKGGPAFAHWTRQRNLPLAKTVAEYISTRKKYAPYYDERGNIDGTAKLKSTKEFDEIYLDSVYYLDFYAIEGFGKTRLGTLLHYAKQGQNKYLMSIMLEEISDRVSSFIEYYKPDAIGFVPPTIRREVQLMKFMENGLKITLPTIEIKKLSGIIPVPQKSLSKMPERISNAEKTFAITDRRSFEHVLLIDDAVGSGATLNQISGKIRKKKVAKKVTGLAIVGSFKGFDVVTDV